MTDIAAVKLGVGFRASSPNLPCSCFLKIFSYDETLSDASSTGPLRSSKWTNTVGNEAMKDKTR